MASPASAASTATVGDPIADRSGSPHGTFPGGEAGGEAYDGGLFDIKINGAVTGKAYCIDISVGETGVSYTKTDWPPRASPTSTLSRPSSTTTSRTGTGRPATR